LFDKKRNYGKNIQIKIHTLFIPFIVWETFYAIFEYVGYLAAPRYFQKISDWSLWSVVASILGIGKNGLFYVPLWFVRALFLINILYPVFNWLKENINEKILLIIALIVWIVPGESFNSRIRHEIAFSILGIVLAKDKALLVKLDKILGKKTYIFAIFVGTYIITSVFHEIYYIHQIGVLLYMVAIYLISKKLVQKSKIVMISERLIKYSFIVYVLHAKLLSIIQNIVVKCIIQTQIVLFFEYVILPIIVTGICIVFGIGLYKISPKMFGFLTGGRSE
jgi:hypothetical protein